MTREIITRQSDATPAAQDDHMSALAEYARDAAGAFAPNTERARRADLAAFAEWCIETGASGLPATPETVQAYVQHLDSDGKAPATIERHIQSIAHMHKAAGVDPVPTGAQKVRLEIRRLKRRLAETGETRGRGQAQPATFDKIARLIAACEKAMAGADRETASGRRAFYAAIRDRAMIALAFASGLRRSEIVALDVRDMQKGRDGATLAIRRSKTDQTGQGRKAGIGPAALGHVSAYLHHSGHASGPLFQSANGNRLDAKEIARAMKRRAGEAGLSPEDVKSLSGHSTRVGATVDALSAGQSAAQVQRAMGWKSGQMVARYGQNVEAEKDAAERERAITQLYEG